MYTFIDNLNKQEFNQFASNYQYSSLLQSYQWAQIKSNFKPLHVGVKNNDKIVGVALILIRKLPLGQKLAYIPRGPLLDFFDKQLLTFFVDNIKTLTKKHGCAFVRVDPAIPYKKYLFSEKETAKESSFALESIQALKDQGFKHLGFPTEMSDSFQPRYSAVLPLDDQTLKNYSKRLKKSIKYTQKRLTEVTHSQHDYLNALQAMINETEQRQDVSLRDKTYFKKLLDTYPESSKITIASLKPKQFASKFKSEIKKRQQEIEKIKDKSPKKVFRLNEQIASLQSLIDELKEVKDQDEIVIGALISVVFGHTIYLLYAGTNIAFTKFYPQELIYHILIEESIKQGLEFVDMGGIQGSLDDGLSMFKSQFTPEVHEYIGEFDLVLSPKYHLFNLAWKLRKKLKALKKDH